MHDKCKTISLYDFINQCRTSDFNEIVINSEDQEYIDENINYKLSFNEMQVSYLPDTLYLKDKDSKLTISNICAIIEGHSNDIRRVYTIICSKRRLKITVY